MCEQNLNNLNYLEQTRLKIGLYINGFKIVAIF